VDEGQLHRVPDSISSAEAALIQVLGTCVHAQGELPETEPGVAVVVGLGVAGLLHLQLLRAAGRQVVGVARSAEKRAIAMELGATAVCSPGEAEMVVGKITDHDGAALVVEAVGKVGTLAQAVRLAFPGGTILVFGTITESTVSEPFPWYDLYFKELTIVNPRAALGRDYDRAIALATDGSLKLEPLWSESFPLADASAAFEALGPGSTRLKVTIDI
jgi:L-iditol 2-dehydrogenase